MSSTFDPRNPWFVEDGSCSLSSSSLQGSCVPDFLEGFSDVLLQNRNPIYQNQTLEDAFARLSVVPNNHTSLDFVGEGSCLIGAAKVLDFDGYGYPPNRSNMGLQKLGWYTRNDVANVGPMLQHNCYVGCDGERGCHCFNSLRSSSPGGCSYTTSNYLSGSQREFQRLFPSFPLSNDELCIGFRGGYGRGEVINELLSNKNIPGLNVNGRRQRLLQPQQPLNLSHRSLYDFRGRVLLLAKDQCGCRVLQETMNNLTTQEEISFIFVELINDVIELMLDPFGNYVFQKLAEICSEEQRTHIILVVTETDLQLVNICLDTHGTRAIQKLLEHVTTQEQRSLVMSALSPGAVALTKDANGLHVIEHCLKHFPNEDNEYLLNIVANHCFDIATDKNGCCVLQHCVDHAQGETKERLMAEIIVNASLLSEDCYGNYVVQHLLSLNIPRITESLLRQLEGKFLLLSCNKYGSNVVEKFYKESGERYSRRITLELLHNPNVSMLLVDPYGNYVIKSALLVSKGAIRDALLELVHQYSSMMRSNLYGQKLLARFDRSKLRHM